MIEDRKAQMLLNEYFKFKGRVMIDPEELAQFLLKKGYILADVAIGVAIVDPNEEAAKGKRAKQEIPQEALNDPLIQFTNALGKENGSA